MCILEELGLDDSQYVKKAMKDYFSDQAKARGDLRKMLTEKVGVSDDGIDNGILDYFLDMDKVKALLYGSIVSSAVAEGRSATSMDAMSIMGWVPSIDTTGKPLPGDFLDGCSAKGHELYMGEIWEEEAKKEVLLAELDMKHKEKFK